jgi:hypothetical protein
MKEYISTFTYGFSNIQKKIFHLLFVVLVSIVFFVSVLFTDIYGGRMLIVAFLAAIFIGFHGNKLLKLIHKK